MFLPPILYALCCALAMAQALPAFAAPQPGQTDQASPGAGDPDALKAQRLEAASRCARGEAPQCLRLAALRGKTEDPAGAPLFTEGAQGLLQAGKEAEPVIAGYQKACDLGYYLGCLKLAQVHEDDEAGRKDLNLAVKNYRLACERLGSVACAQYADRLEKGFFGKADPKEQNWALERSCLINNFPLYDLKSGYFCNGWAAFLDSQKVRPKDAPESAKLLHDSCLADNAEACAALSSRYRQGRGVARSEQQAVFYEKRCRFLDPQKRCRR